MTPATSVKLSIPSEIRLVDLVHEASHRMAELAGFEEDEALNVALAVREAVINAIMHGNHQDPKESVNLQLIANGTGIVIKIRDHGVGFDPERTADPRAEDNRLRTSGRGLLLIRAFVDEVKFRRHKAGGMEVTLVKRVRPDQTTRAASSAEASDPEGGMR